MIPILQRTSELKRWLKQQKKQIHFVPTMGALHDGHKELIQVAKNFSSKTEALVLVSIYINHLQFGKNEDFQKYPRNLEKDAFVAAEAGADAVWAPNYEDIFPGGTECHFQIKAPENLKSQLCGITRKKHFDGVSTVIVRLLSLTKPNILFLGEKDWQQLIIIRQLVQDLGLPVKVRAVPTIRDNDGLAFSSRNNYLSKEERDQALALPNELKKASQIFQKSKNVDLQSIKSSLQKNHLKVEYVEAVDLKTLTPLKHGKNLLLLAAAIRCGDTRLIDHNFLMSRLPIVAIDGPAGAGKSTVSKTFAKKLGLLYLDTGAMYRAVTWLLQSKEISCDDEKLIENELKDLKLELKIDQYGEQNVFLNSKNITSEIRSPEVTSQVPVIAAKQIVRKILTNQQQQIGKDGGIVAEGRDIGSTVYKDAELKIFLTASAKERARRRAVDLEKRGFKVPDLYTLEQQIKERDHIDSTREIAPLVKAQDAQELVTDGMNIEEVIDTLIEIFRAAIPEEVWPTPSS